MNIIQNRILNLYGILIFIRTVIEHLLSFIKASLSSNANLALKFLAAESQLAIYNLRIKPITAHSAHRNIFQYQSWI